MKNGTTAIILAAILGSVCGTNASLTEGLVAYYPFNGNANDESGNGHDGVVVGSELAWGADRFGLINRAAAFNGQGGYIELPLPDSIVPTTSQSMTVSFWVKKNITGNLITKYTNFDPNNSNFDINFDIINSQMTATGIGTDSVHPFILEQTDWLQYAVVLKSGENNTRIYQNGQLLDSGTVTYNEHVTSPDFVIGKAMGSFPGFVNGIVDDVRIYNRTLSESEVGQLYSLESAVPEPSTYLAGICTLFILVVSTYRNRKHNRVA